MLANSIVAIVNDRVITLREVREAIRNDAEFLQRRYAREPQVLEEKMKVLQEERLEQMVEHALVLQEFNTLGYPLPESYINNRLEESIKQYGDRLTLTKTLQAEGITFEAYKKRIREETILNLMWAARVPRDPLISPTKIENYYLKHRDEFKVKDRAKLRMIALNSTPENQPIGLAKEIAAKIKDGASFADMARVYSQSSSGANGGDQGWVERGQFLDEILDVAFALQPGTVSEPIVTPKAVFLIMVDEAQKEHVQNLTEIREDIEKRLKAEEIKRLRKQFVDRLKKKAYVRYF